MRLQQMSKKNKQSKTPTDKNNTLIATNRKARHDYNILTTYQAGLVLMGSEVKSIRAHKVSIADAFVQERHGELWLMNAHIAQYEQAKHFGHTDPIRPRKLLLHRKEIIQIMNKIREVSYTAVPLRLYMDRGLAKLEIATAQGKRSYDKRADIAKRDAERQMRRAVKER